MKTKIIWILIISLVLAVASSSAQEFTFTTSAANITAAMARITDPPSLAGNLQAIIVATPLGTTQTSIRHTSVPGITTENGTSLILTTAPCRLD